MEYSKLIAKSVLGVPLFIYSDREVLRGANTMRMTRVMIPVLLIIGFCGCKSASREKEAAAIIKKANAVWAESGTNTKEWTAEYGSAFGPEDRGKFPANRTALRTSADKILKILDEETRLVNDAIQQYEQAVAWISDERQRKGISLLVSSMRKTLEGYEFVKSQMRLVTDESIVNAKTFEERFLSLGKHFGRAHRESNALFEEGKRMLGM